VNINNHVGKKGFYDSICTCKKCDHKMSKYCFKSSCKCCDEANHSVVMDGFEGFEPKIEEPPSKRESGSAT
jgi:hypothetical protein